MTSFGLDLSPAHFALLRLDDGVLTSGWIAAPPAQKKRLAGLWWLKGFTPLPKTAASLGHSLARLDDVRYGIVSALSAMSEPGETLHVAVEDYAFAAAQRAHQVGETGGTARLAIFNRGARLRLYAPTTIKFAATGTGKAEKEEIRLAMLAQGAPPLLAKQDPDGDFYDAFAIARICWRELQLRAGLVALSSLSEHERIVFNRVTKSNPDNVLSRPWTFREDG